MKDFYSLIAELPASKRELLSRRLDKLGAVARDKAGRAKAPLRGGKRLVAYVVHKRGPAPTVNELKSFLAQKLPEYMVPSAIVYLDSFPLTPNGKIDRRALPKPGQGTPGSRASFAAPRNEVEEVVAGIWQKALEVKPISVHDDFFELGGHSLLATKILHSIKTTFKVELPVRSLFEATTVEKLSRAIIAHEAVPGQTEKIAQAIKKVKILSAEDAKNILQKRRKEKGGL